MAYRKDQDLEVLQYADNEQLEILVKYLTEEDGVLHLNEMLTNNDEFKRAKKSGSLKEAWRQIAAELQSYGGHTIVNLFRNKGVLYREIVLDLCNRNKIEAKDKDITIDQLESHYVMTCFSQIYSSNETIRNVVSSEFKVDNILSLLSLAEKDNQVYQYILTIVAEVNSQSVGASVLKSGISVAFLGLRIGSLMSLVTWVPVGVYELVSRGGPDYKITSQAVAYIAFIRMLQSKNIEQEYEV